MMHLRRQIFVALIITLVYNYCVYANEGLDRCKEQMTAIFPNVKTPLLSCIQYAITTLDLYDEQGVIKPYILANYPDVAGYYESFITRVSADDILLQDEFCNRYAGSDSPYLILYKFYLSFSTDEEFHQTCLNETAVLGSNQREILYNALYFHKMQYLQEYLKEGSSSQNQSSSGANTYKHPPNDMVYYYLVHISSAVKLLEISVEPYILTTHPNKSEVSIVVDTMNSPEDYCLEVYGN